MATVFDVADYVLKKQGSMTATKLQKLCYYSQAWHLVWEETALFQERIEAWANGPVVRSLYRQHRLQYLVDNMDGVGDGSRLTPPEKETVDVVLGFYGSMSGAELSELTHREDPWRRARAETPPGERSDAEIPLAFMAEYYEGLLGTAADRGQV